CTKLSSDVWFRRTAQHARRTGRGCRRLSGLLNDVRYFVRQKAQPLMAPRCVSTVGKCNVLAERISGCVDGCGALRSAVAGMNANSTEVLSEARLEIVSNVRRERHAAACDRGGREFCS